MSPNILFTIALLGVASAYQKYVTTVPNGANVPGYSQLGHVNANGGGARNAFGSNYQTYGSWTRELCLLDSDGDGFSNGLELG